jgi:hypothetical protein
VNRLVDDDAMFAGRSQWNVINVVDLHGDAITKGVSDCLGQPPL